MLVAELATPDTCDDAPSVELTQLRETLAQWKEVSQQLFFECEKQCMENHALQLRVTEVRFFECERLSQENAALRQRLEETQQQLSAEQKRMETIRTNFLYTFCSRRHAAKHLVKLFLAALRLRPAPDPSPFLSYDCVPARSKTA